MIRLKGFADLRGIWRSGQIAYALLDEIEQLCKPGISSGELNTFAGKFIAKHSAQSAFLNYRGYPASICTSFNEEVVHGIPGPRQLREGDLLSVDVGITLAGYVSDTARTFFVGTSPTPAMGRLISNTQAALAAGLQAAQAGQPIRLISRAIQIVLEGAGLGVIRELSGHGVGFALHEDPPVYNFDSGARKPSLQNGMVIAVEPMASLGTHEVYVAADRWTHITRDGSAAAHFEHTMACWDNQTYVLTDQRDATARATFGDR